jgi:hypothetical protein
LPTRAALGRRQKEMPGLDVASDPRFPASGE